MTSIKNSDISLDNTVLNRVQQSKFLGIIIDENLTWKNHINCLQNGIKKYWCHEQTEKFYSSKHYAYSLLYFSFTFLKLWHTYLGKYL